MYWYHFCIWENIDSKTTFQRKHYFLKKKVGTKDTFAEKRCDPYESGSFISFEWTQRRSQ